MIYAQFKIKSGKNSIIIEEKGAVALSSILILAIILLITGLAMAFSEFTQNNIVYNQNKATDAFYAAESGAKDALQKIARNKDYATANYCLALGQNSSEINVVKLGAQTEITSKGISGSGNCAASGSNYKRIKVMLDIGAGGKATIASWEELGN